MNKFYLNKNICCIAFKKLKVTFVSRKFKEIYKKLIIKN